MPGSPYIDQSKASHDPQHARELIAAGVKLQDVRKATGFGYGTIYKIRDNPDYVPNENISKRQRGKPSNRLGKGRPKVVQPPLPVGQEAESLKTRILVAISAKHPDRFDTAFGIRDAIRRPGESIDGHSITHLLFSLRSGGWIRFHEVSKDKGAGSGGQTIVTDIRLSDQGFSLIRKANGAAAALRGDYPPVSSPTATPAPEEAQPAQVPAFAELAPPAAPVRDDKFPLIRALVMRPTKIRAAATLLREAGMEEAATLIEAELVPSTPLEEEILRLLKVYDIQP